MAFTWCNVPSINYPERHNSAKNIKKRNKMASFQLDDTSIPYSIYISLNIAHYLFRRCLKIMVRINNGAFTNYKRDIRTQLL